MRSDTAYRGGYLHPCCVTAWLPEHACLPWLITDVRGQLINSQQPTGPTGIYTRISLLAYSDRIPYINEPLTAEIEEFQ